MPSQMYTGPPSRTSRIGMPKVKVGKIRRRVHNRDPKSVIPDGLLQHPTVASNEVRSTEGAKREPRPLVALTLGTVYI